MSGQVSWAHVCHLGLGPDAGGRARNEDNFLVCHENRVTWMEPTGLATQEQPGDGLFLAVCDGMGGHTGGDVASAAAVRVLSKLYQPEVPRNAVRVMVNYLHEAHRSLHRAAAQQGPVTMGTTATVAWLLGPYLYWAHVGDSRLYLFRGNQLFRLTSDQTRNEFARRDGRPEKPDGNFLAQNFIYGSRGFGHDPFLRLDRGLDAGAEPLEVGDLVLACSDGLHSTISDERIRECLAVGGTPQGLADALLELALDAGTRDNVTAVVVRVESLPERTDDAIDDPEETVQF